MIRLNDIITQILSYHPNADLNLVEKAYVYSAKVHQGQVRLSGEPYLSHPLEVAFTLARMRMDVISVVAGLLHDTLEDTSAELPDIERLFGKEAANIVNGVTKISKIQFTNHEERQAENIRKMILAMATDIRVIMVKLADRLHNMQTLGFQSPEKQASISRETLEIYAPLAGRLGIYWVKFILEDLCLYYLEPETYKKIKTETAQRRGAREKYIRDVKVLLNKKFIESGIEATIKGRQKHLYSIYSKMKDQNLTANQVYDILALRVIVNSVKQCYEILGLIHEMWKPIPGKFKDYISLPKANMYQSLHTTVVGPLGQRMEVQIRTWQMDKIAEEGIAAHWKYKEGQVASKTDESQFSWLRRLLEWQKDLHDPKEFLDTVRMDLFQNEVYVFTPKGEVKEFPKGATPVDFAYSIHTEIGNRCTGARIKGKLVPLRYELQNGDIVEIITSNRQHPSKDWLEFVKTPRAKTKIRHWVKDQERDLSIELGKDILERALVKENIRIPNLLKSEELLNVSNDFSFHSVEDLFANIGYGKLSANQIIGRLKPKVGIDEESPLGIVNKVVSRMRRKKSTHGIKVTGLDDILVRFANCCHPLPGEQVIGYITHGRGVTIHKHDCRHVIDADPDRLVEIMWDSTEEDVYLSRLKITTVDKRGILADISGIISQKNANIVQADVKTTTDKKGICLFSMEVGDYKQLQDIIGAIKKLKDVLFVERV